MSGEHWRSMVVKISQRLYKRDCNALHYIYKLPYSCLSCNPLSLLDELQQRGKFSQSNPNGLELILKRVGRPDLANIVKESCQADKDRQTPTPYLVYSGSRQQRHQQRCQSEGDTKMINKHWRSRAVQISPGLRESYQAEKDVPLQLMTSRRHNRAKTRRKKACKQINDKGTTGPQS